jgi:beta-lactamase class A
MPSSRRTFLLSAVAMLAAARATVAAPAAVRLRRIERELDGRLGLFACDSATGARLSWRADERFPLCSTFKLFAAAAVLARSGREHDLLQRRIHYRAGDLVSHSPQTERHVADGMTVAELCAAAIQYSDNSAGNLLLDLLGGSGALTAYARTIGDEAFRLDRREPELNAATPGDPRDTTTPRAMGQSLQHLLLGTGLAPAARAQLRTWLQGSTTGGARIRSVLPPGWEIGDKTGGGDYGTANDVAVLWPPRRAPVVLAIYSTRKRPDAGTDDAAVAAAAAVALDWLDGRLAATD